MPWYRTVIAAGFEDYLKSLGVQENVIAYIRSAPANFQQILVNEARKNPAITVQQLSAIPQPKQIDPYTPVERMIAEGMPVKQSPIYSAMKDWLLIELKRHRRSPMRGAGVGSNAMNERLEWVPFYNLDFLRNTRQSGHANISMAFQMEIREIQDWAERNQIQLSSYTLESASAASDEWHESSSIEDGSYQERNIIFGPKWSGKDFEGWTIQEIRTENDLKVEGSEEKMNHCVGDYFNDIAKGKSKIFSLRDPHNEPHVTIETDGAGTHVKQIRGKKNHEPKPLYKQMIAEWIASGQGPKTSEDTYYNDSEDDLIAVINNTRDYSDIDEVIKNFGSLNDEYGLRHDRALPHAKDSYEAIMTRLTGRRGNDHYQGWMRWVAVAWVNLYVFNPDPREERDIAKIIEDKSMELDSHLMDYSHEGVGEPYPDEDNFETREEYDAAVEMFNKKESEWADYYWANQLPYAFVRDCWKALDEAQKKKKEEAAKTNHAGAIAPA